MVTIAQIESTHWNHPLTARERGWAPTDVPHLNVAGLTVRGIDLDGSGSLGACLSEGQRRKLACYVAKQKRNSKNGNELPLTNLLL